MTVRILHGDCRDVLPTLPAESVHCVVTSPPYFGLRDYGVAGQIGLEPSPEDFIAEMVLVFREVRRVLRRDGTCWLNLGDSYAGSRCGPQGRIGEMADRSISSQRVMRQIDGSHKARSGAKPGDMLFMPHRVVMALQADGWWARKTIIWAKPNPMPESAPNRPTSAHEYLFLLAKSGDPTFWTHREDDGTRRQPPPDYRWLDLDNNETALEPPNWREEKVGDKKRWRRVNLWSGNNYLWDGYAIREDLAVPDWDNGTRVFGGANKHGANAKNGDRLTGRVAGKPKGNAKTFRGGGAYTQDRTFDNDALVERESHGNRPNESGGRNIRDVWTISSSPFPQAHFATFPPKLVEPCIMAGTSAHGCCSACGAPWTRVITKGEPDLAHQRASGGDATGEYHGRSTKDHAAAGVQDASAVKARILAGMVTKQTTGWRPTCGCPAHQAIPCTVLGPFGGAGTTGLVADRLGRDAVLIEINSAYAKMATARIQGDSTLLGQVHMEAANA